MYQERLDATFKLRSGKETLSAKWEQNKCLPARGQWLSSVTSRMDGKGGNWGVR